MAMRRKPPGLQLVNRRYAKSMESFGKEDMKSRESLEGSLCFMDISQNRLKKRVPSCTTQKQAKEG
jgi:hypothetical protein